MIRRIAALALMLAAAGIVVGFALSGGATHATGDFEVPDPLGDTFGKGPGQHDITLVSGSTDGSNFILTVQLADVISPPSAHAPTFSGNSAVLGPLPSDLIVGYIDFDIDQNPATQLPTPPVPGAPDVGISGGPPVSDHVTQWCPDPSGMGVDASLNLGSYDGGSGLAYLGNAGGPVGVAVSFAATSFTATIPLSAIGGDLGFNFGMVLGNQQSPTDCAPDDGGSIKPSLVVKATPTATETPTEMPPGPTPTATSPAPEPSATIASAIVAPDTGGGGSPGSAPLLPWALAGAAVCAGAAAAAWAYRRRGA